MWSFLKDLKKAFGISAVAASGKCCFAFVNVKQNCKIFEDVCYQIFQRYICYQIFLCKYFNATCFLPAFHQDVKAFLFKDDARAAGA